MVRGEGEVGETGKGERRKVNKRRKVRGQREGGEAERREKRGVGAGARRLFRGGAGS